MGQQHYSGSTPQYGGAQDLHYTTSNVGGTSTQGATSQTDSISRGQDSTNNGQVQQNSDHQQNSVQITSSQYSNQGKSDVRVTNPGSYSNGNYNNPIVPTSSHEQQVVSYTSTPSYNHQSNRYEHHPVSSASYHQSTPVRGHSTSHYVQPTPVYGHSTAIYGHHSVPVYHYTPSSYGQGESSGYSHSVANSYQHPTVNGYSQGGSSAGNPGLLGVSYSPAVSVSHMSYTSPVGISYAW